MSLRSGVPEEQDYALHHLVKISHERGDKFKFDAFIGFAEGLIDKALEIASLFYDVKWEVSYGKGEELNRIEVLDGIDSTHNILERISKLSLLETNDGLEPAEFSRRLKNCVEAVLVLRNMSMLEENARYLAEEQIVVKDVLTILLNLPNRDCLVEVKHDALDITEQLTKFWALEPNDPLYLSILSYLQQRDDRGASLSALRAICRISLELEESNRLQNIPINTVEILMDWCLLDDDELVGACLDFFYQFTAVPENVALILTAAHENKIGLIPFINQLGRLLLHGASEEKTYRVVSEGKPAPPAQDIPEVPQDLLEQLINIQEPERSSAWLKACFEEDPESDMTQIKLWQAYQTRFQLFSNPTKPLLQAAEFIKNISATFTSTSAQVLQTQSPPKFIIKGIRPRRAPVDLKGRSYMPCLWINPSTKEVCGSFHLKPEKLYDHIIKGHLGVSQDATGKWEFDKIRRQAKEHKYKFNCTWAGCQHFAVTKGVDHPFKVGMHIKTHLPDSSSMAEDRAKHNSFKKVKLDRGVLDTKLEGYIAKNERPVFEEFVWKDTLKNERGEAIGLPLTAVLVLRNIARTIPKAVSGTEDEGRSAKEWLNFLFGPLMSRLWYIAANNRSLTGNIYDLVETIEKGVGE
jgi:chromatin structure-remodeling complex subunit RSC9